MKTTMWTLLLALAMAAPAAAQSDLDLPIGPAKTQGGGGGGGGTDPKDDEPPIIWGEEIDSESDSLYYVLDISGSMDWDSASYTDLDGNLRHGPRIDRAKVELIRSISGLSANFEFNIIAYDCSSRRWAPAMQSASAANKAAAIGWVRALAPLGATGTGPATALALGERENLAVVLLTDGAPNCGAGDPYSWDTTEAHRTMIRGANLQHATITVFGIAASGDYRAFCQNVAADSGGSYFDVP
jgi:hypothetical protein